VTADPISPVVHRRRSRCSSGAPLGSAVMNQRTIRIVAIVMLVVLVAGLLAAVAIPLLG